MRAKELLARLDRTFRNVRRDIRIGLRCRFEIVRERYQEALSLSKRIQDKTTFFYKKIRLDALEGELGISALKDDIRTAYEAEMVGLEQELMDVTADRFLPGRD